MANAMDEMKRRALSRRGFLGGVDGERGGGDPRRLRRQRDEHAHTGGQADDGPDRRSQRRGAHHGGERAAQRPRRRTAPATTGTTAPTAAAVATSASTTGSAAAPTTAAASAAATGQGKPGGSILIGTLGEAKTINPFLSNESEGDWRVKMLFDQLVRLKPDTFEPKAGPRQVVEDRRPHLHLHLAGRRSSRTAAI